MVHSLNDAEEYIRKIHPMTMLLPKATAMPEKLDESVKGRVEEEMKWCVGFHLFS